MISNKSLDPPLGAEDALEGLIQRIEEFFREASKSVGRDETKCDYHAACELLRDAADRLAAQRQQQAAIKALKRYRVHLEHENMNDPLSAIKYVACPPDPDGGWVRYADLAAVLAEQDQ